MEETRSEEQARTQSKRIAIAKDGLHPRQRCCINAFDFCFLLHSPYASAAVARNRRPSARTNLSTVELHEGRVFQFLISV